MKELKVKDLNFINAAFKKEPMNSETKKKIILFGVPILIVVLCLGSFGILQLQYLKSNMSANTYTTAISDLENSSTYQQAVEIEKKISNLQEENDNAEALQSALNSYPEMSQIFFSQLNRCITSQISITSYNYTADDGLFVIEGKANGISETAAYVQRLRNTGLFYQLEYSGYNEEMVEQKADTTESDTELAQLQQTADETAAIAAANPDDVSAQLAAQIAAMQLATAKQSAANDTTAPEQVTTTGNGYYLFAITGILNN